MADLTQLYQQFSIIPLGGKYGKEPFWKEWTKHCKEKAEFSRLENHKGNFGICCGFEGLEVIDIDNHFLNADALLAWIKDNFSLSVYLMTKTQGGGYHIYYKCDNPKGSLVLAKRKFASDSENGILPDGREVKCTKKGKEFSTNVTMIETRGDGGQVVFYDNIISGSIDSVPKITDKKRDELFEICEALNEVAEKKTSAKHEKIKVSGQTPGDAYNNDPNVIQETFTLLIESGWQTNDNTHWWRPGKNLKESPSATFGRVGVNRFYNFSSNAYPFEQRISNSMFGVRAILKHDGDFVKCAKELAEIYNIEKPTEKKKSKNKWFILADIIKDWKLKFRYNELTTVIDVSISDKKYEKLSLLPGDIVKEMETKRGVRTISTSKVAEMIGTRDICQMYNPIREFFNTLPKWTGKDYFDILKKYIILDKDENEGFFFSMLKKHLIRTIRCALQDKYINRMVFVLYGPQEIGKSEFFRWLLPSIELYNEETVNPSEKDSVLALSRYIIINMDELDGLNKKEVSKLKAFISHGTVTKRVSYGRYDENFARIASFVASTNKSDILADEKNTRWIILKIDNFDWKGYTKNIDPLQLWAQCLALLKENHESGELTKEEKTERDFRNDSEFLESSSEREILQKYFEIGNFPITATEIKRIAENKLYPLKFNFYQLVRELKRMFGEPKRTRENDKAGRYYYLNSTFFTEKPEIMEMDDMEKIIDELPF